MDLKCKEALIHTAQQIRDRYRVHKRGQYKDEQRKYEVLKPIVESLNMLVKLKEEEMYEASLPVRRAILSSATTTPQRPLAIREQQPSHSILNLGTIASEYLGRYLAKDKSTDTTYGIRIDNGKFYVGSREASITNNDINIGDDHTFKGTTGLWQLLTLKEPDIYTQEDLNTYKDILELTHAHRRGYESEAPISANKHSKYRNIIKPLFTTATTPSNVIESATHPITVEGSGLGEADYVVDINALVDRWRVSLDDDEIQSIIKELTDLGVIYKY